MANPNISNSSVNTLPAGLADMSMISPNPTVVSVITVMYTASTRPCSVPPITAYPMTPIVVIAINARTATVSRRRKRLNSMRSEDFMWMILACLAGCSNPSATSRA